MAYTSLAELPQSLEDGSGLAWQVAENPNIDQERVLVNADRIRLFSRVAGFSGLVINQYQGEQTTYDTSSVNISDFNADGSVTGSAAATTSKAKRERADLSYDGLPQLGVDFRWPVGTLSLNRDEFALRAADRANRGKDTNTAWAQECNSALRRGLAQTAIKKLECDILAEPNFNGVLTFTGAFNVGADFVASDPVQAGVFAIVFQVCSATGWSLAHKRQYGETFLRQKRWSLLTGGVQYDRILAAVAVAESSSFVKYRT